MKRNSSAPLKKTKCPIITPIKLEKKPANGPNIIPVMGADMKTQLYQTPEKGKGGPINESQITFNAAKTAIEEIKTESFSFFTKTPKTLVMRCF